MENKELISVVVPVYNVEKYLKYSIESIINQTYKNLEIILVDDGSTDSSSIICDEYSKKDSRIKVIHKENGGLADARNVGISNANGMYIGFLDSDDYIHPTFFEKLYNLLKNNNADISECEFIRISIDDVDNSIRIVGEKNSKLQIQIQSTGSDEALGLLYGPRLAPYIKKVVVWNKLYRRELFCNLKFPVGRLHEDEFTTFKVLSRADKIVSTNEILHGYIQTKNSIMRKEIKQKRIDDNLEAYIESSDFFKNAKKFDIEMASRRRYLENCVELSGKVYRENSLDKEDKLVRIAELYRVNYEKYMDKIVESNDDKRVDEIINLLKDAYDSLKYSHVIKDIYWDALEKIINKVV